MLQATDGQQEEDFQCNDTVYVIGSFKVHPIQIDFATADSAGKFKYYLQELTFWRKLRLGLFGSLLWYEYRHGFAGQDFFSYRN